MQQQIVPNLWFDSRENRQELDHCWERFSDGGEEGSCGWLKDRYGLSWQVMPKGMAVGRR